MSIGLPASNKFTPFQVNLEMVCGRDCVLDDIVNDLKTGHSTALVGGRKIGKTTVLRKLEQQILSHNPETGLILLPIYIDTLRLPRPLQAADVYEVISHLLVARLQSLETPRTADKAFQDQLSGFRGGSLTDIARMIEVAASAVSVCGYLRVVVLLDEVGPIVSEPWGNGFFANWRSLLSNTPGVQQHVAIVMAGAREIEAIASDVGSPLANVLLWKELAPISYGATRELIELGLESSSPTALVRKVFIESGGHPFLIQFLMHQLANLGEFGPEEVATLYKRLVEETQIFDGWSRSLSSTDRQVYAYVGATRPFRRKKHELVSVFGDEATNKAITVLTITGICRETRSKVKAVHVSGQLFRTWFFESVSTLEKTSGFDRYIYSRLFKVDPELSNKYLAAWAINAAQLSNYSGAVGEMRDVVTRVLHLLAPDDKVMAVEGFKLETGQSKPTRSQRVRFICASRKIAIEAKEFSLELELFDKLVDLLSKYVGNTYATSSSQVHLNATRRQAWICLKQMDAILAQLLQEASFES